ncbi:MAG: type II toxin-antitoxin system HipA family toxin [Actinomycetaceae bacterium]|nr:type II toxin-antitoxin system HipA family toxin [Actinomycetaceae bacterium]
MVARRQPISEEVYAVRLAGERIGSLRRSGVSTKFAFDADYWERHERAVLGRWFEDHPRKQPRVVNNLAPAWFSNLLPEGKLRDLIAHEQSVIVHRDMDLLACVGSDLPGAVEVVRDLGSSDGKDFGDSGSVHRALLSRKPRRASLAGMALKFSVRDDGGRLALPAQGEDGDWIVKTPDASYPDLPANEFAVMGLARQVGIEVPHIELRSRDSVDDLGPGAWPSDETDAYAVRRFDRSAQGRIHIEDFAQVLNRYGAGDGKYRSNVETVAGLAYRGKDHASLQEMVRRTVFNLLVGNGDAHLKNWSLIYPDGRRARLSPAYDLVCTSVYLPDAENPALGLPFFGATRLADVGREHFARLQERLGVGDEDVLDVVDDTVDRFFAIRDVIDAAPAPVRKWITGHMEQTASRLHR